MAARGLVNSSPSFNGVFVNKLAVDPTLTGYTVYIAIQNDGIFKCANFQTTDPNGPAWIDG